MFGVKEEKTIKSYGIVYNKNFFNANIGVNTILNLDLGLRTEMCLTQVFVVVKILSLSGKKKKHACAKNDNPEKYYLFQIFNQNDTYVKMSFTNVLITSICFTEFIHLWQIFFNNVLTHLLPVQKIFYEQPAAGEKFFSQ